jgi:hypothetical protein
MFHKTTMSGPEIILERPSSKMGDYPELVLLTFGMMDRCRLVAVLKRMSKTPLLI